MKKLVATILVLTLMLCVGVSPAVGMADAGIDADSDADAIPAGLMQRVYAANRTEALKSGHASTQTHMTGVNDIDYTVYWDDEYQIETNLSEYGYYGVRVTCDRYDYIARKNGEFRRVVSLDTWRDMYQLFQEDIMLEEVLSAKEAGGVLVVTTAADSGEVSAYYGESHGEDHGENRAESRDVSEIREERIYELDAETMELRSFRREAVFPDGSREVYREITMEHDVERPHPEAVEAIENHLSEAEEMRTTTFVYDEGTPFARTYVFPTPVGDQIFLWSFDQYGFHYVLDPERSEPTNQARDNDAIYYLVRAEE